MLFAKRLNSLCEELKLTNNDIAKFANLDPSVISRLRNGTRKAVVGGENVVKISFAITACCSQTDRTEELESFLSKNEHLNENLQAGVYSFLTDGLNSPRKYSSALNKTLAMRSFSRKFSTIKSRLGVSNVKLAQALNVEASIISKYLNASRIPQPNSPFIDDLCRYLYNKSRDNETLLSALPASVTPLPEFDDFEKIIRLWLFDDVVVAVSPTPDIEEVAHSRDEYKPEYSVSHTDSSDTDILHDIYMGTDGFIAALRRFISELDTYPGIHTVNIYYDFDLSSLMTDNEITSQIIMPIVQSARRGNNIRVIFGTSEHLAAHFSNLKIWTSTVFSSNIHLFTTSRSVNSMFSQIIFACEDVAAIYTVATKKTEENARITFSVNPGFVNYLDDQLRTILPDCHQAIRLFDAAAADECAALMASFAKTAEPLQVVYAIPPMSSLDERHLYELFNRAKLSIPERRALLELVNRRKGKVNYILHGKETVTEYYTIPPDPAKSKQPLNDLLYYSKKIAAVYTVRDYERNIISIRAKDDGIRRFLWTFCYSEDTVLFIKRNYGVLKISQENDLIGVWTENKDYSRELSDYFVLAEESLANNIIKHDD